MARAPSVFPGPRHRGIRHIVRVASLSTMLVPLTAGCLRAQDRDSAVSALFERARDAQRAADQPLALARYDSVLMLDSTYAVAYNNRGNVRLRLGDTLRGIADYTNAMRFRRNYALAYQNRGRARIRSGDPAGLEDMTRAITIDSGFARAWYERGAARYRDGAREAGLADIRRAAALGHTTARRYLGDRGEVVPATTAAERPASAFETEAIIRTALRVANYAFVALLALAGFLTLVVRPGQPAEPPDVELVRGERLLWRGVPDTRITFSVTDFFLIPFGLVWTGIVLLSGSMMWASGAPRLVLLFFIPFAVAGAFMLVGRYFWDVWRRQHTGYVLTSNRLLVVRSRIGGRSFHAMSLDSLPGIHVHERRDGLGTIAFVPDVSEQPGVRGRRRLLSALYPSLELIPDAAAVSRKIQAAQEARTQVAPDAVPTPS